MKITYDIYPKYEKCILKLVYKYCKKSRFKFDELLSEANMGFMHAVDTFDEKKASFHTHCHTTVDGRLRNFIRKINPSSISLNDTPVLSKNINPEKNAIFRNLIENMSNEAQEIVDTIFNTPAEMIELSRKMKSSRTENVHIYKNCVYRYFKEKKGWRWRTLQNCYHEICKTFDIKYNSNINWK